MSRRTALRHLLLTTGDTVVLADVGARGGLLPHWEVLAPLCRVLAFEPEPAEAEKLARSFGSAARQVTVVPAALWDSGGRRVLHVTRSPGASSLLAPDEEVVSRFPASERLEVVADVEIECTRLDDALDTHADDSPDFLKIDVQGGALPVLRGGERTLAGLAGAEVEVEFLPIYRGESLFGEVDAHMRERGFDLVDLRPTYWRRADASRIDGCRGQLVYCDTLYMVRPEVLEARISGLAVSDRTRAVRAAITCAAVYGLYDRIVSYGSESDDPVVAAAVAVARRPSLAGRIPESRYRHLGATLLKDVGDVLLTSRDTWAPAESGLGNGARNPRFPWLR